MYNIVITPPTTSRFSPPVIGFTSASFNIFIAYFLVCLFTVRQKSIGKIVPTHSTIEIITHIEVVSKGDKSVLYIKGWFEY